LKDDLNENSRWHLAVFKMNCGWNVYRYALKFYELKDDGRDTFNEQILGIIKPKIFKNGNKLDGYGLKK